MFVLRKSSLLNKFKVTRFFCADPKTPPPDLQQAFFKKIQEQQLLGETVVPQNIKRPVHDVYEFSDYTIFKAQYNYEGFRAKLTSYLINCAFVGIGAVVLLHYNHPYIAILPAFLTFTSILQYRKGSFYTRHLVKEITMSQDLQDVTIQLATGDAIVANIENIKLTKISDIKPLQQMDNQNSSNYVIVFDCAGTDSSQHKDLRVMVRNNKIQVDNFDLLKQVLSGDIEQVRRYRKVDRPKDQEEKELEKKLEAELFGDKK